MSEKPATSRETEAARLGPPGQLRGTLHAFVAFDWGSEIDLAAVRRLIPVETTNLARRRRTPTSIAFHPPPVCLRLPACSLSLPGLGTVPTECEATLFDFGAVSLEIQTPMAGTATEFLEIAAALAESEEVSSAARRVLQPLFTTLQSSIERPNWSALSEEYFVFELPPDGGLPEPAELSEKWPAWLAGLARLENEQVCAEEIAESLRLNMRYGHHDLLVLEWSAAVLTDRDCAETLQVIELANLQLLEFRLIDTRLDEELAAAYRTISPLVRAWLPFWRTHMRPLRALGELRVDAKSLFDRTSNVLKMMGDQYLARLYRRLSSRFHLEEWASSIRESLEVAEGVYQVIANQAATYRVELLEIIIVLLILFEIVMAIVAK